jgi:hypothetical protein
MKLHHITNAMMKKYQSYSYCRDYQNTRFGRLGLVLPNCSGMYSIISASILMSIRWNDCSIISNRPSNNLDRSLIRPVAEWSETWEPWRRRQMRQTPKFLGFLLINVSFFFAYRISVRSATYYLYTDCKSILKKKIWCYASREYFYNFYVIF